MSVIQEGFINSAKASLRKTTYG